LDTAPPEQDFRAGQRRQLNVTSDEGRETQQLSRFIATKGRTSFIHLLPQPVTLNFTAKSVLIPVRQAFWQVFPKIEIHILKVELYQ